MDSSQVRAQRYALRSRTGTAREVEETIRRLSCVQLDSISAVERSHRIALTCRVGAYRPGTVPRLLAQGRVFEYWAHEACLLPIEDWPIFAAQMRQGGRHWYGDVGTLPQLSMGMSGDFGVAIEEGATLVRVGTAIFGDRSGKTWKPEPGAGTYDD